MQINMYCKIPVRKGNCTITKLFAGFSEILAGHYFSATEMDLFEQHSKAKKEATVNFTKKKKKKIYKNTKKEKEENGPMRSMPVVH